MLGRSCHPPRGPAKRPAPANPYAARQIRGLTVLALASVGVFPVSAEAVQQSWAEPLDSVSGQYRTAIETPHSASVSTHDRSATPIMSMKMTAQVADNLALLFERFSDSEFILCLEGGADESGELRLTDFRMPHIAYSRSSSAGVYPDGTCSQYDGVIGTLHNHPATKPLNRGGEWKNCYLSRTDIVSWLKYSDYPYTAVMCGPRMWAWWHRSQVVADKVVALPPDGQLFGRDATAETTLE